MNDSEADQLIELVTFNLRSVQYYYFFIYVFWCLLYFLAEAKRAGIREL